MFEFNALLFPDLITISLGHWDIFLEPGTCSVQIVNMMPFLVIHMGKIMYNTTKLPQSNVLIYLSHCLFAESAHISPFEFCFLQSIQATFQRLNFLSLVHYEESQRILIWKCHITTSVLQISLVFLYSNDGGEGA
jgi:hypothetical protein